MSKKHHLKASKRTPKRASKRSVGNPAASRDGSAPRQAGQVRPCHKTRSTIELAIPPKGLALPYLKPNVPPGTAVLYMKHGTVELIQTTTVTKPSKVHGIYFVKTLGEGFLPIRNLFPLPNYEGCTFGKWCPEHGFSHGAEAEELRQRLEALIESLDPDHNDSDLFIDDLRAILDETDARDSLAYVERNTTLGQCSLCAVQCSTCAVRGKKSTRGTPPRCGFTSSGAFNKDNYMCGLLNKLRVNADWTRRDDMSAGSIGILQLPDASGIPRGYLVMNWYKERGCLGRAVIVCEDHMVELNLPIAERISSWLDTRTG